MPSYTPIAGLPYPVMSDAPNGPEQIQQLAQVLEPKINNRYASAAERDTKIPAPALGMRTFRDDDLVWEYWNGSSWVPDDQTVATSSTTSISTSTDRNLTTTESPALVKSSIKIVNPSKIYRMMWIAYFDFSAGITWTTAGQYLHVRQYVKLGSETPEPRRWSWVGAAANDSTVINGAFPVRTGFLKPSGNITVQTWITVEKTGSAAATGSSVLVAGSTELTLVGITTL